MNNVLLREQQVFNYKSINAVTDVAKAYAIYKTLTKASSPVTNIFLSSRVASSGTTTPCGNIMLLDYQIVTG